jgi:hypothetical protein
MKNLAKIAILAVLINVSAFQIVSAYDVPTRKIEIKPYMNLLMASEFWVNENGFSLVENKTGIGFGAKIRTQVKNNFGMVLNASLTDIKVVNDSYGSSVILTIGGFYSKSTSLGNFIFDCGYGFITAGNEVMGVLMPAIEFGKPISERIAVSVEFGWPIVNDWLKEYGFEEHYGSFTISIGSTLLF